MIQEFDKTNKGYLNIEDFMTAIACYKLLESENEENDTLEAFVAMGGSENKEGDIDT